MKRKHALVALVVAAVAVALMVLERQEIARLRRMLLMIASGRETAVVGGPGTQAASASPESAIINTANAR
jgi:hypothetical protein